MTEGPGPTERAARLFDELAPGYDRTGTRFFGPIAARLVELLDVRPGERALDLGCGRGAVTFRLAESTGPTGHVTGVDVSPRMVELTAAEARHAGLTHVEVTTMDATRPTLPERSWDVVASSLVLFFLPDPATALGAWVRLVAPDGRLGITSFGPQDDVWAAVDALFAPYLPPEMLDARTSGTRGPFATDQAMERLFTDCGARRVRTVQEPLEVHFVDAAAWRAFSMSIGQRMMWRQVPEDRREELFAEAAALLEGARRDGAGAVDGDETGDIVLTQQVRYTLAGVA